MDTTALQDFIKEKYKGNYGFKHPNLSDTNEASILNSIQITNCRYCNSSQISKKGFTNNNVQRYVCKNCGKKFIPTTGTIFENHKISITEWIEFLLDIFNYSSTSLTSRVNKNCMNTSIYWLHKTFLVLKNWQNDILLEGSVYIDEMCYKVIKSDIETKDGKQLRGQSRNQYCIGIGYDDRNILAIVEGLGKTSTEKTRDTFINHIQKKSKLIHDDEKSHSVLVDELNLKSISYSSTWLKDKKDDDNPLRPINHQCDLIRQFLNAHSGFDRADLQDYLNLYSFMNSGHKNKLKKVHDLIALALTTNVTLEYRELFKPKSKDY